MESFPPTTWTESGQTPDLPAIVKQPRVTRWAMAGTPLMTVNPPAISGPRPQVPFRRALWWSTLPKPPLLDHFDE